ncbi:MAG: glycine--tRNA ligase subunit alpha [Rickettsiales bacterium]|nr:glycine--tRNA ligase subunit alpha [Rickettsiales bacterium]
MVTFQDLIFNLQNFWSKQGCVVLQPYDLEMGAATFHPSTSLNSLGTKHYKSVYTQCCRRPSDGRYGENPNRLQQYYQMQVLIKPSPKNSQELYLKSLETVKINIFENDIKFIEDNWESPTLGAAGVGWEIQCNGAEISQFTYFQQMGGIECKPVSLELTYGLERIAMMLQNVDSIFKIKWNNEGITYGELFLQNEKEFSKYNFEYINISILKSDFKNIENECIHLIEKKLLRPAYEKCIKASHVFNLLDARGALSVSERQSYILLIRGLTKKCCELWMKTCNE